MLEELRKLPALPPTTMVRIKRKPTTKKKSRNLIKVGQEASIPPHPIFLYATLTMEWNFFFSPHFESYVMYLLHYISKNLLVKKAAVLLYLIDTATVNSNAVTNYSGLPADLHAWWFWHARYIWFGLLDEYYSVNVKFSSNSHIPPPPFFSFQLCKNTGCLWASQLGVYYCIVKKKFRQTYENVISVVIHN